MSKKKILLVDDSSTVVLMQRMMLSQHGHEISVARDGKEALQKAREVKPDLIFLDVVMPGMNGFDTCRALRAMPEHASTPIIMVTTRGEPQSVEQGYASGCTEYMTKPFDALELAEKLRTYLGG